MATGNIAVKHFRFRNDDGSESGATWLAGQDTNATLILSGANKNFRLRFVLANTTQAVTAAYGLSVARNGGAAASVNATSSYIQGVVSSNLTNGANTTEQLSLDATFSYVTTAGVVNATSAASGSLSTGVNQETEVEWSLVAINSQLSNGDTLVFTLRLVSGTPALTQFSSNITLTISSGATAVERRTFGFPGTRAGSRWMRSWKERASGILAPEGLLLPQAA